MERRENDILNSPELKKNPFSVPDNYFSTLENRIHERIDSPEEEKRAPSFVTIVKPYISVAASFLILFGVGFGIFRIVDSLSGGHNADNESGIAFIDEGFLKSSFVDFMYEEIEYDYGLISSEALMEEIEASTQILMRNMNSLDIYEFMADNNNDFTDQ